MTVNTAVRLLSLWIVVVLGALVAGWMAALVALGVVVLAQHAWLALAAWCVFGAPLLACGGIGLAHAADLAWNVLRKERA